MPCQSAEKEAGFETEGEDKDDSFLLLQQSVTLGSLTDVDQLIAKIGETLKQIFCVCRDRGPSSPWSHSLHAVRTGACGAGQLPTVWQSSPRAPASYPLCPCSLALRDLR
ncbi:GSK-3-binding protein FRAT2 [Cricetulus griseus]|uniref:GSK-3-binding protein FRAT2 n=1 Tax=Cricetulus griseus TaxID=10029 RepID=G3IHX4_CRIGR|nr:GSK-3-binding protein FRAT2 [Cricetulus griseus]